MVDLSTNFLGLEMKNPIMVGSCSLTSNLEDIIQLEQYGAGAIVLKSLFAEEIEKEYKMDFESKAGKKTKKTSSPDILDYLDSYDNVKKLSNYLQLIKSAKKKTSIPIIASVNCTTDISWVPYTSKIQDAGADAIEINVCLNPLSIAQQEPEKVVKEIISKLLKEISIPVSIKIGECYSNLSNMLSEISNMGISGLVLFNKNFSTDIDIYNLNIVPGKMQSSENEYVRSLRWIALLSDRIACSLAASTGIHHGNTVIKQILAGADAVQVVSALYLYGKKHINQMLMEIEDWMFEKGIFSIDKFRGKASYLDTTDPAVYERMEFMKQFGRVELAELKMQI